MSAESSTVPSIGEPTAQNLPLQQPSTSPLSTSDSSAVASEEDDDPMDQARMGRPKIGSRKSSGTMIVSRESATTVVDTDLDENDVRTMSPRRNSAEVEMLGEEARKDLIEQAKVLQTSLQAIVDRVETVKSEHEKLEGGNKFLQSYIGELMQTSKITSTAPSKTKGKGRSGK